MVAIAPLLVNLPLSIFALWTAVIVVLAFKTQLFRNVLVWGALPHLLGFSLLYCWMVGQGLSNWLPLVAGLAAAISLLAQVVMAIAEANWRPVLSRVLIHCAATPLFIACLTTMYPGFSHDVTYSNQLSKALVVLNSVSIEGDLSQLDKITEAGVLEQMLAQAVKSPERYSN